MDWRFKPSTEQRHDVPRQPSRARAARRTWVVALTLTLVVTGAAVGPRSAHGQVNKRATLKLLVRKAEEARKAKDFSAAGAIWLQIYLQAPTQPMSLYNAALMEEKAGDLEASAKHFREFLSVTTKAHPRHTLARVRLKAVVAQMQAAENSKLAERLLAERRARERAEKARVATKASSVKPGREVATERSSSAWLGWTAAGVGGAFALAAGGLYAVGISTYADVDAEQKAGKISLKAANVRVAALQRNDVIYAVMGGVGLVGVAVGAYLLVARPATPVAVVPWRTGRGVAVAWRF